MAYKNYKIRDNWLDLDKYNNVDIQSVDGVIQDVKVNGEEYGGGGSSDFSTAEVTVIVGNVDSPTQFMASICVEEVPSDTTVPSWQVSPNSTATFNVVLYKGNALATIGNYDLLTVSVSGDIVDDEGDIYITGDGTITIS